MNIRSLFKPRKKYLVFRKNNNFGTTTEYFSVRLIQGRYPHVYWDRKYYNGKLFTKKDAKIIAEKHDAVFKHIRHFGYRGIS